MGYLAELRVNWRFVLAAAIGLGCGHNLNMYTSSLFAPHLIREFGWSKAQFALIGTTILIGVIVLPIAGRLADKLGVRRMASIGIVASPLIYVALSMMSGSFTQFLLFTLLQGTLVGTTTTSLVYSRLIAEQFVTTRGLALSIAACSPAIATAIATPLLSAFIDGHGWRAGYLALGAVIALAGAATLLLIPRRPPEQDKAVRAVGRSVRQDYPEIWRNPTFRLILAAQFLCHLTLMVQVSQMKLVLLDRGMASAPASLLLSLYAAGIVAGRLLAGLALDRFAAHVVTAVALGLPAIGFLIFGSGVQVPALLAFAMLIVGMSTGADFGITAYLVMRFFRVAVFSTVYSLLGVGIAVAGAIGSVLLSLTLKLSDGSDLFFLLVAILTIAGGLLFLRLASHPPVATEGAAR